MSGLRANTLKDRSDFFLHLGLTSAVAAGAFFALGFPPLLGLAAVGITAGLRFGLAPMVKGKLQEILNEEHSGAPDSGVDPLLKKRIANWIGKYSDRLGLEQHPQLVVMAPKAKETDEKKRPEQIKEGVKEALRKELLDKFNQRANAFAFAHDRGNVVLTNPIVNTLDHAELKGVVAHEVGHLAAGHLKSRGVTGLVSVPAKILTGLNMLVTAFSSFKNAGLYIGVNALTNFATKQFKKISGLDEDKPKEKAKIALFRRYFGQAALAGTAVVFGAPEMLAAQALHFATTETFDLIEKSQSRRNEFQADRIAAQVTGNPEALCTALRKVRQNHLEAEPGFNYDASGQKQRTALSAFFDRVRDLKKTHPNVERRCSRLMRMEAGEPAAMPA